MPGKKSRPIRIEIPEELELTENEIASLERAFKKQLEIVERPGDIKDVIPFDIINTTKMAVEIDVISPNRQPAASKPAKKPPQSSKSSAKKSRKNSKK